MGAEVAGGTQSFLDGVWSFFTVVTRSTETYRQTDRQTDIYYNWWTEKTHLSKQQVNKQSKNIYKWTVLYKYIV